MLADYEKPSDYEKIRIEGKRKENILTFKFGNTKNSLDELYYSVRIYFREEKTAKNDWLIFQWRGIQECPFEITIDNKKRECKVDISSIHKKYDEYVGFMNLSSTQML